MRRCSQVAARGRLYVPFCGVRCDRCKRGRGCTADEAEMAELQALQIVDATGCREG